MTRKSFIALVSMTLLLCSAGVSAGSSDIGPSLNGNEDGRYVLLFQKDGFYQYLDRTFVEDRGDYILARILAIPEAACNDPGNKEMYVGVFGFRKSGKKGAVFSIERYSQGRVLLAGKHAEVENPAWEDIPPGHPIGKLCELVLEIIQIN